MNHISVCRNIARSFLVFSLACASAAPLHADERVRPADWRFAVDVHLYGAAIGGTTGTGDDIDISFSDLIDNLDFALMGRVEARKERFSVFADVIYLNVKATNSNQFSVPVGPLHNFSVPVQVNGKVSMKSWIATAAIGYNLLDEDQGSLDLFAGARYLWLDLTVGLDANLGRLNRTAQISGSDGNLDAIVGVRGTINLDQHKKWYLGYYGDVGAGDSDFTWAAQGSVGYRFEKA